MATVKEQFEQIHGALAEVRDDQAEQAQRSAQLETIVGRVDRNVSEVIGCIKGERGLYTRVAVLERTQAECNGPRAVARNALHIKGLWAALGLGVTAVSTALGYLFSQLNEALPVLSAVAEGLRRLSGGP